MSVIYFSKKTWQDLQESLKESNEYIFCLKGIYRPFEDMPHGFDTDEGTYDLNRVLCDSGHEGFRIFRDDRDIRTIEPVWYPGLIGKSLRWRLTNSQRRKLLGQKFEPHISIYA